MWPECLNSSFSSAPQTLRQEASLILFSVLLIKRLEQSRVSSTSPESAALVMDYSTFIGRCPLFFYLAVLLDAAGLVLFFIGIFAPLSFWDFLVLSGPLLLFLSLVLWIFWYLGNLEVPVEELLLRWASRFTKAFSGNWAWRMESATGAYCIIHHMTCCKVRNVPLVKICSFAFRWKRLGLYLVALLDFMLHHLKKRELYFERTNVRT